MASIPKPIRDWISQFFTEKGVPQSSADVDHDQTSNRTHEGDDLSPATLEADSATINGTADVVELLAETLAGADIANASENQILVAQGDGTLALQTQAQGPNPYDQAQSFDESDVTVETTDTVVGGGSISIFDGGLFDITTATFSTSINAEDDEPFGLEWNNDGSKLYELGQRDDKIHEYDVSTSYDITTATLSNSIDTIGGQPSAIAWNDDGTKLYEVARFQEEIYEYDVSTAYDITTASQESTISTQDENANDITWNNDGSKLYEIGQGNNNIYEYDVSTAYDITTATFSTSINTEDGEPVGLEWNNDGSKLYEMGEIDDKIYEYDVSTPYDITTATLSNSIDTMGGQPSAIAWNDDGSKLYTADNDDAEIREYDLPFPELNGSATIEWDRGIPTDIFEWDIATFTESPDGETVDVFVAYDDPDDGWTRANGGDPIDRNYSLNEDGNITTDVDVRIETELSRDDTANNPTLDSAYRSWLV